MSNNQSATLDWIQLTGITEVSLCSPEVQTTLGLTTAIPVLEPSDEEELAALLRTAGERGLAVIPMGAGRQLHIGEAPRRADAIVSSRRLSGIVEHSVGDLTMTVKAGTTYAEIQTYLRGHGQHIPLMPPTADMSTIGGLVAVAASGPERVLYGSWRDNVIGLRVVYPDGSVIRTGGKVVKNVAGYDMNKLFVGSSGTLGFISEVTLRVRPYPKHKELVLVASRSLKALTELAAQVLASECVPSALELLSQDAEGTYVLAVGCDETVNAARYQTDRVAQLASAAGGVSSCKVLAGEEVEHYWREQREAWASAPSASATLRAGWAIPHMAAQLARCEEAAAETQATLRYTASLGAGTLRIRLESTAGQSLLPAVLAVREAAERQGGYAVLEQADAELKAAVGVWGSQPAAAAVMKGIKKTVDPGGMMSPGRFVGGI